MATNGLSINPRDHPDNAHLPNVNRPATIQGVTITFLVSPLVHHPKRKTTNAMWQSMAIIAICLRLWVRIRDRLWGWDDLFVLLAGLASIIGDTFVCLSKLWSTVYMQSST
jgi:hypothetical protein